MQFYKRLIKLIIFSSLLTTSLLTVAFANPSLVSEMADLDQVILFRLPF